MSNKKIPTNYVIITYKNSVQYILLLLMFYTQTHSKVTIRCPPRYQTQIIPTVHSTYQLDYKMLYLLKKK